MQRRALVVGVSQYSKVSLGNFVSFANNANAIADILEPTFKVKRLPEAVDGDRVLVGESGVTCDRLQNELKELFTATDLDVVLFYFSGHGLKGKQLFPRTYLAASDSEGLDDGYRRAFEIEDLKNLLKNCPAREQIVWLDCCYGGDLANFAECAIAMMARLGLSLRLRVPKILLIKRLQERWVYLQRFWEVPWRELVRQRGGLLVQRSRMQFGKNCRVYSIRKCRSFIGHRIKSLNFGKGGL